MRPGQQMSNGSNAMPNHVLTPVAYAFQWAGGIIAGMNIANVGIGILTLAAPIILGLPAALDAWDRIQDRKLAREIKRREAHAGYIAYVAAEARRIEEEARAKAATQQQTPADP